MLKNWESKGNDNTHIVNLLPVVYSVWSFKIQNKPSSPSIRWLTSVKRSYLLPTMNECPNHMTALQKSTKAFQKALCICELKHSWGQYCYSRHLCFRSSRFLLTIPHGTSLLPSPACLHTVISQTLTAVKCRALAHYNTWIPCIR